MVACKPIIKTCGPTKQSRTVRTHTLLLNYFWYLHSTLSAITHKLLVNVSGHMLIWTFFLLLFWYVELLPKVCPHLSVTPCICIALLVFRQGVKERTCLGKYRLRVLFVWICCWPYGCFILNVFGVDEAHRNCGIGISITFKIMTVSLSVM
jgi:hypothetical protein